MNNFNLPKMQEFTFIKPIAQKIAEDNYASNFATRILEQVNTFNNALGDEYEAGVCLANFGEVIQFPVAALGYINPSLLIFFGIDEEGSPRELIQHVSQINFALTSIKRKDTSEAKRPIGVRTKVDNNE